MPYIHSELKADGPLFLYASEAGVLTYKIQQAIQEFLLLRPVSYERLAAVLGSLEGAKADFTDRVLLPYERRKREENGDVWNDSLTN